MLMRDVWHPAIIIGNSFCLFFGMFTLRFFRSWKKPDLMRHFRAIHSSKYIKIISDPQ
jgi:hypothetical protein